MRLFSERIVAWQREHGRNHLPWQSQSPYHVWLSEVMLQQTQVASVLPYYAAFIARYPTVADLAAAPIDEILAMWAGLGYYSRARNLHHCAKTVLIQYGGQFPQELAILKSLPGIGPSTAAAIASLGQGQRAAILDGNVKRVLARHGGVSGWPGEAKIAKALWQLANDRLIPDTDNLASDHHRRYTQGLMDLGATVCSPRQAKCLVCPVASDCAALRTQQVDTIPARRPKKVIPSQHRCAAVLHTKQGVWLERRPAKGIWGGLLSFPEATNTQALEDLLDLLGAQSSLQPWHIHQLNHPFTHYHLRWEIWGVAVKPQFKLPSPWVFAQWNEVASMGVPKAVLKALGR